MIDDRVPGKREAGFLEGVFFVPEEVSLPSLTPRKFAEIHCGFYPAFDPVQFREFLVKFELNADQNCSKMSHGQKKKALIAFALATNTRYLFLDEPTSGMDIPSKAAFRSILAASFLEGKTVILSTHMVRDLESMIDGVIILNNHRIILNQAVDQDLEALFNASINPPDKILYSTES
jgi:ABC-2 type transport system ATP-binding protein